MPQADEDTLTPAANMTWLLAKLEPGEPWGRSTEIMTFTEEVKPAEFKR